MAPANLLVRDISRGLVITNNSVNPQSQIDLKADEILLEDDNYSPFRATGVNLTIDIAAPCGVNGLDDGIEEAYT